MEPISPFENENYFESTGTRCRYVRVPRVNSVIGKGAFGCVFLVQRESGTPGHSTDQRFALKRLHESQTKDMSSREIEALSTIHSPFVCGFVDAQIAGKPFIVMDYIPSMSLKHTITSLMEDRTHANRGNSTKGYLHERVIWKILADCLLGLYVMHKQEILHRDIKPSNIIDYVDENGDHIPCICDLGFARHRDNARMTLGIGTPGYRAPELFADQPYDTRVDVFALGVTILELLTTVNYLALKNDKTGLPPFLRVSEKKLQVISDQQPTALVPCSNDLLEVISMMLSTPERPRVSDLLATPPITGYAVFSLRWYLERTMTFNDSETVLRRQQCEEILGLLQKHELFGRIPEDRVSRRGSHALLHLDKRVMPPVDNEGGVY
ncbi:putative STE family protein kinase [Blattamonas nauphoetae]|uniref:non-specific serine/threonine protein kinase n=1 Tax=Blattamonas nauphoetae TaxID=2049346 RepID=A0ABQ9XZF1_9EUKA|nr:putative STE family protein kinase [Blattamonas nauphoetae]